MAIQIIQQPDGKFCLWSSISDAIVCYDADEDEVHEYFEHLARDDMRRAVEHKLQAIKAGERPYCQFTKTYKEALREHRKNHGALKAAEST